MIGKDINLTQSTCIVHKTRLPNENILSSLHILGKKKIVASDFNVKTEFEISYYNKNHKELCSIIKETSVQVEEKINTDQLT